MTVAALNELADQLRELLGSDRVLTGESDLLVYECDGFVIEKNSPDIAVFPTSTHEVSEVVKLCNASDIPFLPRGAGTSLAGGCLPVGGGVIIVLTRMNAILDINLRDGYAIVQPGVVNVRLTEALKGSGYHYAPDPSSQGACTIGGNVATNSGGPHTLKYGVTVNHVLGVEVVMADGQIAYFGGRAQDGPGLDLTGTVVGSEGLGWQLTRLALRSKRPIDLELHPIDVTPEDAVDDDLRRVRRDLQVPHHVRMERLKRTVERVAGSRRIVPLEEVARRAGAR